MIGHHEDKRKPKKYVPKSDERLRQQVYVALANTDNPQGIIRHLRKKKMDADGDAIVQALTDLVITGQVEPYFDQFDNGRVKYKRK